jgi:isoleucyl-tRNA synthetase
VYHSVYEFATVDLSAVYFDVLKDRLYTSAPKSHARRSAQTALRRLAHCLVRLVAPLLAFTSEEVWGHLNEPESVHLASFPKPAELTEGIPEDHRKRASNWDRLMKVRGDVLKSLESARNGKLIGAPLEAHVHLSANGDLYPLLRDYSRELPGLFIVSQVSVGQGSEELSVRVERASGAKCPRCWKYTEDIGSHGRFPSVCAACAAALEEMLNG